MIYQIKKNMTKKTFRIHDPKRIHFVNKGN